MFLLLLLFECTYAESYAEITPTSDFQRVKIHIMHYVKKKNKKKQREATWKKFLDSEYVQTYVKRRCWNYKTNPNVVLSDSRLLS